MSLLTLSLSDDGEKLYRDFGIRAKGLVELGAFAIKADDKFSSIYNREIVSLAKMVAMYLGRTLLKGKVRTSNWEADLSRGMVECKAACRLVYDAGVIDTRHAPFLSFPFGPLDAANDCHCALMVYNRLQEIADRDDKRLDVSMYSCQVNPRPLKPKPFTLPKPATLPTLSQSINSPTGPPVPHYCIPEPPRPQQLRAYKLWHVDKMPLDQMCMKLRTGARVEPLKESTVM